MMRRIPSLLLAVLVLVPFCARAALPVKITVTSEHSDVVQSEELRLIVTVENNGYRELTFGPGGAALRFDVEREHGDSLGPTRTGYLAKDLVVPPGETRKTLISLSSWYNLSTPARYFVRARLTLGEDTVYSRLILVSVVKGIEVLSVTRPRIGSEKVLRTYSLRYWARDRHERLFLCISDEPDGPRFSAIDLGNLLRIQKPTMDVGMDGVVTVTHQSSPVVSTVTRFRSLPEVIRFVSRSREVARNVAPRPPSLVTPKAPGP